MQKKPINIIKPLIVFFLIGLVIHGFYSGVIRPQALFAIDAAREQGLATPWVWSVLLKDWEQEVCIILMFFCIYVIGEKYFSIYSKEHILEVDLLGGSKARSDEDSATSSELLETLMASPDEVKDTPLFDTLMTSLRRFDATKDVQHASSAIHSSIESVAVRLEAENTIIRYIIWAIPSIGFIGTVRGISKALSEADKALNGDLASITESLGVAFNSTMVALAISLILMVLVHILQYRQDHLILEIDEYCDKYLIKRLSESV